MKIILFLLLQTFCYNCSATNNEINGIAIYESKNLAISDLVIEVPIYSISVKTQKNGSFKIILPKRTNQNEDIYIYIKENGWNMIEPVTGEYVIIKPHQRVHPLIIKLQRSNDPKIQKVYNKEKPNEYDVTEIPQMDDKGDNMIQIQVGANKESDFKNGRTIESEIIRLKNIIGDEVKHFKLRYDKKPHRFVLVEKFNNITEAAKVKQKIRDLNKNVDACFFNAED